MVPSPFSRGLFLYGEPIVVPRDAGEAMLEAARLELETVLNRLTEEAEKAVTDSETSERGGTGER
ncbi:hypothetical protein NITMOv2_3530 [Nitrospira moscoviensis]|uniref:Uncharacterized protein n=1 Tax=Nitrospira moscoviensis TaxID=42253 RepID=A0A0K2GH43_NITMO|nr:hypothetical protein NITMOv2_3530 [Nitrospira moscoviensis]